MSEADVAAPTTRAPRRRPVEMSEADVAAPTSRTRRRPPEEPTDRADTGRRGRSRGPADGHDDDPDREPDPAPTTGTRRAGGEPRPRRVGASGTGRSVARARADARTVRVPARGDDDEDAPRAARDRRTPPDEPRRDDVPFREPDGDGEGPRLRADRIDETLTRLTAAHAGLELPARRGDDEADAEDDVDEDDATEPAAPTHPAVLAGKCVAVAVAFLLVLVAGLGWLGRTRLDGALHRVAAVDVAPDGVLDAAAQTGDQNVLLLATDHGSDGGTTRAHTAVVVHRDAAGDRTVAVTLPPDLEITRPPCERWDADAAVYSGQTVPAEPRTTFDSAFAVGGPRCATRAAQQVTGLAITRFVALDLGSTSALVEAVGGVDVCVERPVLDTVVGPVMPVAGTGSLNGARATALVRATDVRDDPAPAAGLVQRQQRVLAAVLSDALAPQRLLHPGRVGRLLPALGTTVVSTGTGVADLLALSRTLARTDGVTLVPAPTEPVANSRGNRVLAADAPALFAAVRTDGPLPTPDPAAAQAAATPADVTADVLNASGRDGLAKQVADTLGELGFRTAEVRNATQPALDTVVRFSPDRAEQAQLLAATVPAASAVPDPGTSGVLQLVLGRSFDGTVRAATAAPTAGAAAAPPAVRCG